MINYMLNEDMGAKGSVRNITKAHQYFLDRNTGLTNDATKQHYVFNPDYVLSNNRHFIAASQQEAQPNGDGTTEGQALQVIGYALQYIVTGNTEWLDLAKKCFDAYTKFFYVEAQNPMPNPPAKWICNWILNSKEPVNSNWPIDKVAPTHSGFKGKLMTFNNGILRIKHGAPDWGQYLDKATFAFDGALTWDAINASVQALKPDGSTDWNKDGVKWDVDWIINWEGKKINWDGDVLSTGHPEAEKGMVKLKDTSVNGEHKFNYATRQPVADGGELIGRNQVQHNRPLHVPVPLDYLGNAADAEEWFADAAYLMWKITGEDRYHNIWQCVLETCKDYANIDGVDKFFRKSTVDKTPFTEGIAYDYSYPSDVEPTYSRDPEGYINIGMNAASQINIEQQAIWFKAGNTSKLRVQFGGLDIAGEPLSARAVLKLSTVKSDAAPSKRWLATFPASTSEAVKTYDIPFSNLVEATKADGTDFILADSRVASDWGAATWEVVYENGVLGGRSTNIIKGKLPTTEDGLIIGFWLLPSKLAPIKSITCRNDKPVTVGFTDNGGWKWHYDIPAGGWRTVALTTPILNDYQPNPGTPPASPIGSQFDQVNIESVEADTNFSWYCFNDVPATFGNEVVYTILFTLTIQGQRGYIAKVGDCTIIDYLPGNLYCTPGVIPFSNISVPDTEQFDGWRGMPYPGYQYPFIYCYNRTDKEFDTHLENMVEFLYQSQVWYTQRFGVVGPGASAYIWNRWDNLKYGKPDTWTMNHWGDGNAWSGYQPRAYCGAARAWYELVINGRPVPAKLKAYTDNWSKWLIEYVKKYNGQTPTDFPTSSLPVPVENDFTGHMCGLWLAGACYAKLAGSTVPGLDFLIESCYRELRDNLVVTDIPDQIMNGSWSPAIRLETGNGVESNGMFFGFWSGEILRGLAMYLAVQKYKPGEDMYEHIRK